MIGFWGFDVLPLARFFENMGESSHQGSVATSAADDPERSCDISSFPVGEMTGSRRPYLIA